MQAAAIIMPTSPQPINALAAYIQAKGNINLAAELYHSTPEQLLSELATPENSQLLALQLRSLSMLSLFDTLQMAQLSLQEALPDLEPADTAKLYTSLQQALTQITDDHTVNVNVAEAVLHLLPPDKKQRVLQLIAEDDDSEVNPPSEPQPTAPIKLAREVVTITEEELLDGIDQPNGTNIAD